MIYTSPINGKSIVVKFNPLVMPGQMLKVHSFPFEPELHFCYDERYKIVFSLYDSFDEAFPAIMAVARMELDNILNKY